MEWLRPGHPDRPISFHTRRVINYPGVAVAERLGYRVLPQAPQYRNIASGDIGVATAQGGMGGQGGGGIQ